MTKQQLSDNFAQNLECERIKLGLSQKEMADELEISLTAYKRILTGETTRIDLYVAYRLYELTGKFAFELLGIYEKKFKVAEKLHGLSDQQLLFVNAVIEFEKQFQVNNEDYEDYINVFVPTGNLEDGMIYDSSHMEKLNVSHYLKKFGDRIDYGIKITSNHLHPAYNKGDILLISKETIRDGDIGLFLNCEDGRAYIRKFHQTNPSKLEPINDYGKTFYVNQDSKEDMDKWKKFGKVLTKVR